MQLEALPINLIHPRKVRKYINSNVCLSLRHSDTVPGLIWYPKLVNSFLKFGSIFGKKDTVWAKGGQICYCRLFQSCNISKEDWEELKQQWVSIFLRQCHISRADQVLKIGYFGSNV